MPLGLGIAVSHSPLLYRPRVQWEELYRSLVGTVPQPVAATEKETPAVLEDYAVRIEAGFHVLAQEIKSYRPEALVMVVCDRHRMFNESHVPQVHVHVGKEIWGSTRYTDLGEEDSADDRVTFTCHEELGEWLVREMIWGGIDANQSRGKFNPLGDPEGGVGHSLSDPLLKLVPDRDIPIVPIHINAHVQPAINGHRVHTLAGVIARALEERPERIAIVASGGLSGDPQGYMAGWIDELLDDWVLESLHRGKSERLKTLWDYDSNFARGAVREIRTWLVVGAAMEAVGAKATVVDYIPFCHGTVGTGFACWRRLEPRPEDGRPAAQQEVI